MPSMRVSHLWSICIMIRTIGESLAAAKLLCVGLLGLDGLYWGWGRGRRPPPRRPQGPAAATA